MGTRVGKFVVGAVAMLVAVGALSACKPPDAVLSGHLTVLDSGGYVAVGIEVTVYSNASETIVASTTSDGDGDYWFLGDRVPDGMYRVRSVAFERLPDSSVPPAAA